MKTTLRAMGLIALGCGIGNAEPYAAIHRLLRPELLRIDQESTRMRKQQEQLPPLLVGNSGIRRGFHGSQTPVSEKPFALTIDLGTTHPIDGIALVPTEGVQGSSSVSGYDFPGPFESTFRTIPNFGGPSPLQTKRNRHFPTLALTHISPRPAAAVHGMSGYMRPSDGR